MKLALFLISLLAVVCIISASHKSHFKKKINHAAEECLKQYPNLRKEKVIEHVKKHKIPKHPEEKCFAACIFMQIGWIKDDNINWQKVKSHNAILWNNKEDIEKANQVADTCSKAVSRQDDICELAFLKLQCCVTEAKKVNLPEPDMDFEE